MADECTNDHAAPATTDEGERTCYYCGGSGYVQRTHERSLIKCLLCDGTSRKLATTDQHAGPATLSESEADLFRAILRRWASFDMDMFRDWVEYKGPREDEDLWQALHDRLVGDEYARTAQ